MGLRIGTGQYGVADVPGYTPEFGDTSSQFQTVDVPDYTPQFDTPTAPLTSDQSSSFNELWQSFKGSSFGENPRALADMAEIMGIVGEPENAAASGSRIGAMAGGEAGLAAYDANSPKARGKALADWIRNNASIEPYQRTVPSVSSIGLSTDPGKMLSRVGQYVAGAAGQMAGSSLPSIAAGLGVSAVTENPFGFVAGAYLPSVAQNTSDMWNQLKDDKGIQAKVADGTLSEKNLSQIAMGTGLVLGMFDAYGLEKVLGMDGRKFRGNLIKRAIKRGLTGGSFESATEAAQQLIQETVSGLSGSDQSFQQHAMNVLDAGLQGFIGGSLAGLIPGGRADTAAKQTENSGANPATPEGVPAPANQNTGQPTPGGVGVVPPAPAGVSAPAGEITPAATPPAGQAVTALPENAVEPTVIAAVSPVPTTPTPPRQVGTPVGVAVPTVAATPIVPVNAPEEEADFDPDIAVDENEDLASLTQTQAVIQDLLRSVKATATPVSTTPGEDVAAAILAGQQPTPTQLPQVAAPSMPTPVASPAPAVMPEPRGTPEAAARRALPQPVEAPPAPSQVPASPVAAPAVAPAQPAPTAQPASPVAAFQAQPAQQFSLVEATPPADIAAVPADTLAPAAAQTSPLQTSPMGRQFADVLRQEFFSDPMSEHPEFNPVVDRVASQAMATRAPGVSPAQQIAQAIPAAVEAVRSQLTEQTTQEATQAAASEQQAAQRSQEAAKERLRAGAPQERERAGKAKPKSAEGVQGESEYATVRAVKREMEKPEAQRDPDLMAYQAAREARKAVPKRGDANKLERDRLTAQMQAAQKRRVERLAAVERSTAPTPSQQPAPSTPTEGEAVKPSLTLPAVTPESEQEAKRHAKARERNARVAEPLRVAHNSVPRPNFSRMTSMTQLHKEGVEYMKKTVAAATEALKTLGSELGQRISRNNSLEENLAIFARDLLAGKKHPGMGAAEFESARLFAEAGLADEFYNLVTNEQLAGTVGSVEQTVASRSQEETFDEGSNQFLASMPEGWDSVDTSTDTGMRGEVVPGQTYRLYLGKGKFVDLVADRITDAKTALKEAAATAKGTSNRSGIYGMIRRAHIRRLRQLIPNVKIVWISNDEMQKALPNAWGFYSNYSAEVRARGTEHVVVLNSRAMFMTPEFVEDLVVHELTHAATSFAIAENVRGSKQIFERIMDELTTHLASEHLVLPQHLPAELRYGFKDVHELVAEAFSNADFMNLLAELPASPRVQRLMGLVRSDQPKTWWRVWLDAVSNALGLKFGDKSISYLDAVLHASQRAEMTEQQQQDLADVMGGVSKFVGGPGRPQHAFDLHAFDFDARKVLDAVKGKAGNRPWSPVSRAIATRLATTEELKRQSRDLFGGAGNPFERWANLFLSKRALRNKYAEPGDNLTQALAEYDRKEPLAAAALSNLLFEATQAQVDPSAAINSVANKHISKKGLLDTHRRQAHTRLAAEYMTLPTEAKSLFWRLSQHYQQMEDQRVRKVVRNIVKAAVEKHGVTLPTGKSQQDVIDWVMDGSIDRVDAERTADDTEMHKALGKTAESLVGTRALRQIRGTYVPLLRYGKYFFTARHDVKVPVGAALDPTARDKNVMIFANKKDVENYLKSTDEHIGSVVSRWLDPATGKRVNSKDVNAKQFIYVTVQNKTMEMADSQRVAEAQRTSYPTGTYTTSEVGLLDTVLQGNSEILPAQINRLINNVRQSSTGAMQEANIAAITAAHIRQMSGSRAAHRRLKRQNTHGFSRDLVRTTLTANHVMAGHLANLDTLPGMAEAEDEVQKIIDDNRYASAAPAVPAATLWRQAYVKELRNRISAMNARHEEFYGARGANMLMNISFMAHLATPAYLATNLVQPWAVTYPVLATKFGDGATIREMTRAYRDLGAIGTVWRGAKETIHEARKIFGQAHRVYDFHDAARRRGASFGDGALFQRFMDRVDELGFGAQSGIEAADIHEIGRGRVENAVGRAVRVARATAEAAEAVNRYVTGLAALRLAKRRGMTDEQAVDYAVSTVEQTQGGYAAENNPAFMSHWVLRVPLQFKKYGLMYGQLFYGQLVTAINANNDRATRVAAAKAVARLAATTMVMAGTAGLPFWELARVGLLAAAALGWTDDDWETWENGLQQWTADAIKLATSSDTISNNTAEVLWRGASRMLGFDTSSRLGNDSLVLFGDPKSYDEADVKTWMFDLALGAPGGIASDMVKFTRTWDPKYLPFPKVIKDTIKAETLYTKGVRTQTGAVKAPPINGLEAIWQLLGFRPASQAEAWEAGGSGAEAKAQKRQSADRSSLMGEWSSAQGGHRAQLWRGKIAEWNRAHPGKAERIEMGDLRRSLARRKQLGAVQ